MEHSGALFKIDTFLTVVGGLITTVVPVLLRKVHPHQWALRTVMVSESVNPPRDDRPRPHWTPTRLPNFSGGRVREGRGRVGVFRGLQVGGPRWTRRSGIRVLLITCPLRGREDRDTAQDVNGRVLRNVPDVTETQHRTTNKGDMRGVNSSFKRLLLLHSGNMKNFLGRLRIVP